MFLRAKNQIVKNGFKITVGIIVMLVLVLLVFAAMSPAGSVPNAQNAYGQTLRLDTQYPLVYELPGGEHYSMGSLHLSSYGLYLAPQGTYSPDEWIRLKVKTGETRSLDSYGSVSIKIKSVRPYEIRFDVIWDNVLDGAAS